MLFPAESKVGSIQTFRKIPWVRFPTRFPSRLRRFQIHRSLGEVKTRTWYLTLKFTDPKGASGGDPMLCICFLRRETQGEGPASDAAGLGPWWDWTEPCTKGTACLLCLPRSPAWALFWLMVCTALAWRPLHRAESHLATPVTSVRDTYQLQSSISYIVSEQQASYFWGFALLFQRMKLPVKDICHIFLPPQQNYFKYY